MGGRYNHSTAASMSTRFLNVKKPKNLHTCRIVQLSALYCSYSYQVNVTPITSLPMFPMLVLESNAMV